jgi:hypothetical protein
LPARKPTGDGCCSGKRDGSQAEKTYPPVKGLGEDSAGDAAEKAAQGGAAHVEAHDERDAVWRPLLADVSDDDSEDARQSNALEKTPEDELAERTGRRREKCRKGNADERGDDDALAGQTLSERPEEGCGNGDAQRGGRDSHADAGLGRVEETREERKQRLRAVKLEEGAYAAEDDSRGRPGARRSIVGELIQATGYRSATFNDCRLDRSRLGRENEFERVLPSPAVRSI